MQNYFMRGNRAAFTAPGDGYRKYRKLTLKVLLLLVLWSPMRRLISAACFHYLLPASAATRWTNGHMNCNRTATATSHTEPHGREEARKPPAEGIRPLRNNCCDSDTSVNSNPFKSTHTFWGEQRT